MVSLEERKAKLFRESLVRLLFRIIPSSMLIGKSCIFQKQTIRVCPLSKVLNGDVLSLVKFLQRLLKYFLMEQLSNLLHSFHSINSLIQPRIFFFSRNKYSIFTYFCLSHLAQAGSFFFNQCFSLNALESSFVSGAVGSGVYQRAQLQCVSLNDILHAC